MARRNLLTAYEADEIARSCGIKLGTDFHTLNTDAVANLIAAADRYRYRAPKNANGSRARYFWAYVNRAAMGVR